MLGDIPKSQEKVITKIKGVCSSKAIKKKGQIKEERQKKI
jgi:hypothetical protein